MDLLENTETVIAELRSVISFYDDLTSQEKKNAIQYSIETKCPHELFLKLYNLGTSISNLRGKRADLHSKYKEKSTPSSSPPKKVKEKEKEKSLSPYQQFVKEMRPVIKTELPDLPNKEVLKEIGRRWKLKTGTDDVSTSEGDDDPTPLQTTTEKVKQPKKVKDTDSEKKLTKEKTDEKKSVKETDVKSKKKTDGDDGTKKERLSKKNVRETLPLSTPPPTSVPTPPPTSVPTPPPTLLPTQPPPSTSLPISPVPATPDEKGKTRKQPIPKYIKSLVWKTYIGESSIEGVCQACKLTTIYNTSFQCGHVVAEANGGDQTIPNLRPICSDCNSAMGTTSMTEYVKRFFGRDL